MDVIPITLVKEYAYCPRIAYFKVFHRMEPPTESMKYAKDLNYKDLVSKSLRDLNIKGDVYYEVPVISRRYGIAGKVDALVKNGSRAIIVEVKLNTSRKGMYTRYRHHLAQTVAYAVAVEEAVKATVDEALVVNSSEGRAIRVRITPAMRIWVIRAINELRRVIEKQEVPPPTMDRAKCAACFYRELCLRYG